MQKKANGSLIHMSPKSGFNSKHKSNATSWITLKSVLSIVNTTTLHIITLNSSNHISGLGYELTREEFHKIHIAHEFPNHACYMKSFKLSRSLGQTA